MQTMPTHPVNRPSEFFKPVGMPPLPRELLASQLTARDEQFLNMLRGFRRSGGMARAYDVETLLASRSGLNIGNLARCIVNGEVFHFDWQHGTWFPMFQFGNPDMAPLPGIGAVLAELCGVFEPWDIAQWFARPAATLGNRMPADVIALDPESVLQAARCDRYVVDG